MRTQKERTKQNETKLTSSHTSISNRNTC